MASFSSMVAHKTTRPVEDFVVEVAESISTQAKKVGFSPSFSIFHSYDKDSITTIVVIQFTFTTALGATDANIQIKVGALDGQPRVHSAQGFPDKLQPFVRQLQETKNGGQVSTGVQTLQQSNPAQAVGGTGVGQAIPQAVASNKDVAAAAVSLIDIGTVKAALAKQEKTRRYIGASGIGNECMAYHALTMRGFPGDMPTPQLIRIFNQGHSIEAMVVDELRAAGHIVDEVDQTTGEQWEYTSHGGHHVCHLDGYITLLGTTETMTLEIKSMNRKMFETFQKKGVQLSHPHYYDQVQDGLELYRINAGNDVTKCFFVAYCKDNSQYHAEIVEYDPATASAIFDKVGKVTLRDDESRISSNEHEYGCKGCFKRTSCWNPDVQDRGCWHCTHSTPVLVGEDKAWLCELTSKPAEKVCDSFKLFRPEKK